MTLSHFFRQSLDFFFVGMTQEIFVGGFFIFDDFRQQHGDFLLSVFFCNLLNFMFYIDT